MTSWRRSEPIAAAVAGVILVVQLAVPLSRLADGDHASRFGWQMFSGSRAFPHLVVETPDGDVDVDLADFLVRQRAEIDVAEVLPPHLCDVIQGASVVRWGDGEYRC